MTTDLVPRLAERFGNVRVYLVGPGYPIRCVQTRMGRDGSPQVACLPASEPCEKSQLLSLRPDERPF